MPRSLNPGALAVGGGLAATKSVEASSFVHPTQGLDGLIAHIVDPSRAHMATSTGITDSGGFYASDEVEGALQEVGAGFSSSGQNGVLSGGTYTAVGLTITLDATVVRIGTEKDLTGESVVLTNNQTNWVYVDTAGTLTAAIGAAAPSITSPENVLLWKIGVAAGVIATETDARFFVPNIDRKLPFTLRADGTATDRNAEGCFESLDAALLYLDQFAALGVIRKSRILVRGAHTVAATVSLPTDNIEFAGEDGAEFITGAALFPMFDLNGHNRIRFRDITFTCDHAVSAVFRNTGGDILDFQVLDCRFESGASDWVNAVYFPATLAEGFLFENCRAATDSEAINILQAERCRIADNYFAQSGGLNGTAILLGDGSAGGSSYGNEIRNNVIEGYNLSLYISAQQAVVSGNSFRALVRGMSLHLTSGASVTDNQVVLDATDGINGILVNAGSDGLVIRGCNILSARAVYGIGDTPYGILFLGAGGSKRVRMSGCIISNFYSSTDDVGWGLYVTGASSQLLVEGCTFDGTKVGVELTSGCSDSKIVASDVTGCDTGVITAASATLVQGCTVTVDSTRGVDGVVTTGASTIVSGTRVVNPRGAGTYGGGETPTGIRADGMANLLVDGCHITGFYNSVNDSGFGVHVLGGATQPTIRGGLLEGIHTGVFLTGGGANGKIDGVEIRDATTGLDISFVRTGVSNCHVQLHGTRGVLGIYLGGAGSMVTGSRVTHTRAAWTGETPYGVLVDAQRVKVVGTTIENSRNLTDGFGYGVQVLASADGFVLDSVTFSSCYNGVDVASGVSHWVVDGCRFESLNVDGVTSVAAVDATVSDCSFEDPGSGTAILFGAGSLGVSASGNRIHGLDGSLGTGIRITGTAADPSRRFTIADNVVEQTSSYGIRLDGYVQNGTVVGNLVDGFLPSAPSDPTVVAGIHLASTAVASLISDVSVTGNTVLRCRDGIVATGTNDDPVKNLTVSSNVIHHCANSLAAYSTTTFADVGAKGIGIEHGLTVTVGGNTISKIGRMINDSDIESFPSAGGAVVGGQGMYLRNCDRLTVDGNTVTDIMSSGAGANQGIYIDQLSSGLGAGTFERRNISVSDNDVLWTAGLAGNGAGIYGVFVSAARGSDGGGIAHRLTGLAVNGNTIRNTRSGGVGIGAGAGATIRNVAVSGNTVEETDASGIWLVSAASSSLTNVSIASNSVRDTGADAILVDRAVNSTALNNITVTGNAVISSTGTGITVSTAAAGDTDSIVVCSNTVRNVQEDGILLSSTGGGAMYNLNVSHNNIREWSEDAGGTVYGGVKIASPAATAVVVDGNDLWNNESNAIGLWFNVTGACESWTVNGNSTFMSGSAGTESMRFDTGVGAGQDQLVFIGNSFRRAFTGVNFAGSSFSPDYSILVGNTERTGGGGGVGTLAAFGVPFTNSQIANNQD